MSITCSLWFVHKYCSLWAAAILRLHKRVKRCNVPICPSVRQPIVTWMFTQVTIKSQGVQVYRIFDSQTEMSSWKVDKTGHQLDIHLCADKRIAITSKIKHLTPSFILKLTLFRSNQVNNRTCTRFPVKLSQIFKNRQDFLHPRHPFLFYFISLFM